ncbi:MAG TPA: hypothetical protein VFW92_01120 [Candidatus Limnocylindrales bacterium]|nr:hypothetical protein [Candidatus Limnocylindrales bacterium]
MSPAGEPPATALDWRPQLARRASQQVTITNPICEPDWDGVHVLAHFDSARLAPGGGAWLRLIDTEGDDVTASEPDLIEVLRGSILAVDAVIDGFITDQATRSGEGATIQETLRSQRLSLLTNRVGEVVAQPLVGHDRDNLMAFVAVDLLRVDGEDLLDVPLLERKRLLDGLLDISDRVRVSVYTRPPVKPWLLSWQAAGFRGAILKSSNSRYEPTTVTDEWAVMSRLQGSR